MSEKVLKKFEVKYTQVLDEKGNFDSKNAPKLSNKQLLELYETLVLIRAFDEKALNLQKQGRIGTYISVRGQEACQAGAAFALLKDDAVFPTYRESGLLMARGVPMKTLLQYWGGDERGNSYPKEVNAFPISIPVGTQGLHAVGYAMAGNIKKQKFVTLACFGEGASSEGDMHEAMNFAGVFKAPVIFFCQNNQYAISVPYHKQTASETIAQKAIAYGFEGVRVDGNDVLAVYRAVKEAAEKAYAGKGPTLIECYTYRVESHSTSDDAAVYRSQKEVDEWKKKDSVERFEKFLFKKKILDRKKAGVISEKAKKAMSKAVEEYEATGAPNPSEMFNYVYSETPEFLKEQLEALKKNLEDN